MKALFYRKCSSDEEYKTLSTKYTNYGQWLEFVISKTVILSNDDYNKFITDFTIDNNIIKNNLKLMTMDKNDIVSCLLFTNNNTDGYLVYSAGYRYARYVASYKKNPQSKTL